MTVRKKLMAELAKWANQKPSMLASPSDAIRAALAERDAQWRDAVKKAYPYQFDSDLAKDCADRTATMAPLRALMQEGT